MVPGTPEESSATKTIESVLEILEPYEFEFAIALLEAGEEVGTYDAVAEEVLRDRGLKAWSIRQSRWSARTSRCLRR